MLIDVANDRRAHAMLEELRGGADPYTIAQRSGIGLWFVRRLASIVGVRGAAPLGRARRRHAAPREAIRARPTSASLRLRAPTPTAVRARRLTLGLRPVYKCVDTCAAEFEAETPYLLLDLELEDEGPAGRPRQGDVVVVVGSGPIRIGQGIEFDYCSVQAAQALRERSACSR